MCAAIHFNVVCYNTWIEITLAFEVEFVHRLTFKHTFSRNKASAKDNTLTSCPGWDSNPRRQSVVPTEHVYIQASKLP